MNSCIEYQGRLCSSGYGIMIVDRKPVRAHRHAYMQVFGNIPDGLCVCHRCDNRKCINVEHLFLGTRADNNEDRRVKNRGFRPVGELNVKAKLTSQQVMDIRNKYTGKHGQVKKLAIEYSVYPQLISMIIHRQVWKHV